MKFVHGWGLLAVCASSCSIAASAATLGMIDTFEGLSTAGWSSGGANPTPPSAVATGGPAGVGDGYLRLQSSGVSGPGGKLVAFSGAQWAGNYLALGISGIRMDVNNLGATDLSLRLALTDSGFGGALSLTPVLVAAGSGWHAVVFSLMPAALIGTPASTLTDVMQFRLFHATEASLPGNNVAAQLGIDNVTAVPEPASAWTLLMGLAALAFGVRAQHGRRRHAPSTVVNVAR